VSRDIKKYKEDPLFIVKQGGKGHGYILSVK
jgi:hypothetical protein